MRRPSEFANMAWDDPFWHVVRMLVDLTRGKALQARDIVPTLTKADTEASLGLVGYLSTRPELVGQLADYTKFRMEAAANLLSLARTEEQAVADYQKLSKRALDRYGTQSADHHQSSKVVVATIEVLTNTVSLDQGIQVNVDPQNRVAIVSGEHIWVSPRRLDGAIPSLFNPVGIWEIKEYWGTTKGGSKMSDAIYECQLVGQELRMFQGSYGPRILHYAIMDGAAQWGHRMSDMRRAVDLLCAGLLDELLVGREILTEWPRIARGMSDLAKARQPDIQWDNNHESETF